MIVAAAQGESVSGELATNVATAARLLGQAADQGARLVLLPEAFLTGYDLAAFAGPLPSADDLDGGWLDPLRDAARAANAYVLVNTGLDRGDRRTLTTLLIRPDGDAVAAYDKQHVHDEERRYFTGGTDGTSVVVDGIELGVSVCYDGSFPEHARAAAEAGAHAYLNSAGWFAGSEHRRDLNYAARALENGIYVVFSGLAGRCGKFEFNGGSAVYDPEGRPLARLGDEEGVAVAELDPELVATTRATITTGADRLSDLGGRLRL
ncbi:carbon-nitrogen hydrolase family protein [Nocardioides speluncae]|uniref:carbon-nitrogen hydrolase family protein n=1 Tax=Nocardioides speluncae TaxID=2670337 RepID=UPI000D6A006D|nr:carbon-nitrogen hydrolase family protein [Nocardioides speluncae]